MSISGALSNAISGLNSAARAAEVVSSNISNALTEGYGTRVLLLSSGRMGGVTVDGVIRNVDTVLLGDRRLADADYSNSQISADFFQKLESLIGAPTDSFSLSSQLANFEASLVEGASRPELNERLENIALRAEDVVKVINQISDGIQEMRVEADREILTTVDRVNAALEDVRELNIRISAATIQGNETASLEDLRQQLIDEIGEIVSIREVQRDHGAVALFTSGGAILLDGTAATLEFTTSNVIVSHMTQENGLLSGLTINGVDVRTESENSPISGGKLAALFEVRDELGVAAQAQIDAVARDLVERYQDSSVDPTLGALDAGIFTDQGDFFEAANETGLAGRLKINVAIDSDNGGAAWRLRDGIGATTPTAVGDATLLHAMLGALDLARVSSSDSFGGASQSAAEMTASFLSKVGSNRQVSEQSLAFSTARLDELKVRELSNGVDSDYEIQRLLLIEQAYAANAKIIQTVDEMMQTLLRL